MGNDVLPQRVVHVRPGRSWGLRQLVHACAGGMDNRLCALRADQMWSYQHLVDQLHGSRQSVNVVEAGRYDLSLSLAFWTVEFFDLAMKEVFVSPSSVT